MLESNQPPGDHTLSKSYNQFLSDRQATKKAQFTSVVRAGFFGILLGLLGVGISLILPYPDTHEPAFIAIQAYNLLSVLVAVSSLTLLSTLPVKDLDLDEFLSRHFKTRLSLGLFLLLMGLGGILYNAIWSLVILVSLAFIFRGLLVKCCVDKVPSLMSLVSLWLVTTQCGTGVVFSQNIAYAPYNETLSFEENQPSVSRLSQGPDFDVFFFYLGIAHIAGAAAMAFWIYSNSKLGLAPTLTSYQCLYAWFFMGGFFSICNGLFHLVNDYTLWIKSGGNILQGLVQLLPVVIVLVVGRENLFMYAARKFDSNKARSESDGAFIAALLDTTNVELGKELWVHRDEANETFPMFDPRRNWLQGWIVDIGEGTVTVIIEKEVKGRELKQVSRMFSVDAGKGQQKVSPLGEEPRRDSISPAQRGKILETGGERRRSSAAVRVAATFGQGGAAARIRPENAIYKDVKMDANHDAMSSEELLRKGRESLRCIDFLNMSLELMKTNAGGDETYNLSRPLEKDETIDYFMSHSWHDDADEKWKAIKRVAEDFKAKHKRYPTFWLDKTCIDQSNITDSLKVLPVFVMSSKKMLILAGTTYPTRLWCIWEIFTLFSFSLQEVAIGKVQLEPFTTEASGITEESILNNLKGFQVDNACCYDPNEEAKLKNVIGIIGKKTFNDRVQQLAASVINSRGQRKFMPLSSSFH